MEINYFLEPPKETHPLKDLTLAHIGSPKGGLSGECGKMCFDVSNGGNHH